MKNKLHEAAASGDIQTLRILLRQNVKVDEVYFTEDKEAKTYAIDFAARHNQVKALQLLIEEFHAKLDLPRYWSTKLAHFAAAGGIQVVRYLLKRIDWNITNSLDVSPLHWAAKCGHWDVLQCLKIAGYDLNVEDCLNRKLVHWAAMYNQIPVLQYLKAEGHNLNAKDGLGRRPVHFAAEKGCLQTLNFLKQQGCSLQARVNDGFTTLDYAIYYSQKKVIRFLLEITVTPSIDINQIEIYKLNFRKNPHKFFLERDKLIELKSFFENFIVLYIRHAWSYLSVLPADIITNIIELCTARNIHQYLHDFSREFLGDNGAWLMSTFQEQAARQKIKQWHQKEPCEEDNLNYLKYLEEKKYRENHINEVAKFVTQGALKIYSSTESELNNKEKLITKWISKKLQTNLDQDEYFDKYQRIALMSNILKILCTESHKDDLQLKFAIKDRLTTYFKNRSTQPLIENQEKNKRKRLDESNNNQIIKKSKKHS